MVTTARHNAPRPVADEPRNSRDDRSDEADVASRQRGVRAITRLTKEIENRLGDDDAYGQTTVKLRWQAGRIVAFSLTSEEDHK